MKRTLREKIPGFTLLELLVSMSIFATLGLGAYQMLQTVADSHERVRSSADSFSGLNLAYSIIQRDFNQFAPRAVRDEYGEVLPPIVFENEDYIIEFTRRGWRNPAGRQRSRLQRVAYSLDFEEETLTRHFWEVLDRAEDSEPISQLLLEGVADKGRVAPLGMEVVITTNALGETYRLFQMVEPYLAEPVGKPGNLTVNNPNEPDEPDER